MLYHKKALKSLITCTLFLSTACLADINSDTPTPLAPPQQYSGLYLGAGAGYGWQDWEGYNGLDDLLPTGSTNDLKWTNGQQGFIYDFDIGYQFTNSYSIEAGWFKWYNIKVKSEAGANAFSGEIKSSIMYLATKVSTSLFDMDSLHVFAKAGLSYTMGQYKATATSGDKVDLKANLFSPIYGVGLQIDLTPSIRLTTQYLFAPGYHIDKGKAYKQPGAYVATGGIDILF